MHIASRSKQVALNVARDPSSPVELLMALDDSDREVVAALLDNPALPRSILDGLWVLHYPGDVDDKFAAHRQASPDHLTELALHPQAAVRRTVASNPVCPPALLAYLATDREVLVRFAVAAHPSTPAQIIIDLVGDPHALPRKTAERRCPPALSILRLISDDSPHRSTTGP